MRTKHLSREIARVGDWLCVLVGGVIVVAAAAWTLSTVIIWVTVLALLVAELM